VSDPVSHEEPQEQYDRWSRPAALSRRGYVLAVLVPLLVAALAFGAVTLFASDEPDLRGTTVLLPASSWKPGQDAGTEVLQGVLRMDDAHCAYVETGQGNVYAVWPAGWRATREGDALTVYDTNTKPVAVGGDAISTGGESVPVETFDGEPCLPDDGEVFAIQGSVTVAGQ